MKVFISIFLFCWLFASCTDHSKVQQPQATANDTLVFRKGLDLIPVVKQTDSVQILFYKDPDGDPKRYTRFFTHLSTTDSILTRTLLNSLDQSFQEYSQVKDCRSEGKMYLFKQGAEDPLQTIYFSTRCDSCCYVYYINNGLFYYMNMKDDLSQQLQILRTRARD